MKNAEELINNESKSILNGSVNLARICSSGNEQVRHMRLFLKAVGAHETAFVVS